MAVSVVCDVMLFFMSSCREFSPGPYVIIPAEFMRLACRNVKDMPFNLASHSESGVLRSLSDQTVVSRSGFDYDYEYRCAERE